MQQRGHHKAVALLDREAWFVTVTCSNSSQLIQGRKIPNTATAFSAGLICVDAAAAARLERSSSSAKARVGAF